MKFFKHIKSTILTILSILILSFSTDSHAIEKPKNTTIINVSVNGLVCDFCARALEKVFGKREEVDSINVDLDNALVQIFVKENRSIDDDILTELITDSGYNVTKIVR